MASLTSNSPAQTEKFGREFAAKLKAGSVLALTGDLGSGKTQFVKGLVAGAGAMAEVTSPTFTLVHEYPGGRFPIYHFDFFRIENLAEAKQLGLDDYFFGEGVSVVEWADKFSELIPEDAQWISFDSKSETTRIITTEADDIRESRISSKPSL